jgi:hypothetical protein
MTAETIDQVIERLNEIIYTAKENSSRLGYFASLYKRMTIGVKTGIAAGAFENGKRMEKLDVIFANRYLDAIDAYQSGNNLSICWLKAFEASKNESVTVLQHLLLGINAHINVDLGIAAVQTMQGESIKDLKNDFDKINNVIGDLINEVQDELSTISYPMKLVDKVFKNNDEAVAQFSINIARKEAWLFAEALSKIDNEQKLISFTDNNIAFIASRIINPGLWSGFFYRIIRWFEWKDVSKIIAELNK